MSYLLMATALAEDLRVRKLADIQLGEAEAIVARVLDRTGELGRRIAGTAEDLPPRRCDTNECDLDGSCMLCGADQGEYCRAPNGRRA